jgi:ATP adenylyltransferase
MNHENLWAPWRMAYLRDLERKTEGLRSGAEPAGDFLAHYWAHPELDEQHHVLWRTEHGMLLLNRYPYANGHLLIALGEPRPTLTEYEPPARASFWRLVELGMELMDRALNPQGINMGINQGKAAGAGVPEHLHAHLVPRWLADTNFITVTGGVRVIPDSLEAMADQYRGTIAELGWRASPNGRADEPSD